VESASEAPRPSVTRRVTSTDGVGLAVTEHGDPSAPTVVLVHGYPDSSKLWGGVVARLRDDFHVVTYDVRGAGRSDRPRRIRDYAMRQLSDDLLSVIDAVAAGGRVHLVGHDWGGIQSWESAARPETAARLSSFTAVAGPSLDLAAVGAAAKRKRGELSPRDTVKQLVKSWYILSFHLPFAAPLLWRHYLGRNWAQAFRRTEGVLPPDGHPAATITADGIDGIKLYRRNMLPRLLRPRYRRIDVPLVQVGITLRDAFIAPDIYDELPGRMPELWFRRADASHWIPVLDPDTVAGWVRDAVEYREAGGDVGPVAVPADAERHRVDGDPAPV
jgi:pimeloyl-ACP methyl ester carboxylesterase